eukprot:37948-Prorocentrum_lima.AAC.1
MPWRTQPAQTQTAAKKDQTKRAKSEDPNKENEESPNQATSGNTGVVWFNRDEKILSELKTSHLGDNDAS